MFPTAKKFACAAALTASLTLLMPSLTLAQDRDDHRPDQQRQDWANNNYYQMGTREGAKDHQHNKRRNHKHKFKSDDDRRAYEAGYDNSWQGNQDRDRDRNRPH